ncbi:MAG: hypothetical protein LKI42_03110 [Bacteroidales bacterium]|jgi:hypothetical protein|nr:hypothetical protein [Bacteroidales bacterium]MCI1785872.1 hypothetical protein [Bacteroidales bacterium]
MEDEEKEILIGKDKPADTADSRLYALEKRISALEEFVGLNSGTGDEVKKYPGALSDEPIDLSLDEAEFGPIAVNPVQGVMKSSGKSPAVAGSSAKTPGQGNAIMDVMSEKFAWKTDMPGTAVSNVISAISLNDRALFINTLFSQDPLLFRENIMKINAMSSLEEAENYIGKTFPKWNMHSAVVYRFMMAVRRKLK